MADLPQLPFARSSILENPPAFSALRTAGPVTRVRTETGDETWLVTGYELAKVVLSDPRFGQSHPDPDRAPRLSNNPIVGGPTRSHADEQRNHHRFRRLLAPAFSARRMLATSTYIKLTVNTLLDAVVEHGPPCDLHRSLSIPLSSQVMCELLGVPHESRDRLRALAHDMTDMSDPDRSAAAMAEMSSFAETLVRAKRESPADDVFTDLSTAELPAAHVSRIAAGLMFSGHETTVNQLDYGILLLVLHPRQLALLAADLSLAATAADEVMRVAVPTQYGIVRYAREDLNLEGTTVRAGEMVMVSQYTANRDALAYSDPETFDITRRPLNPHLGFGYATHYCLGASLARLQLRVAFAEVASRLSELRLAVPFEELRPRGVGWAASLAELPVTWTRAHTAHGHAPLAAREQR